MIAYVLCSDSVASHSPDLLYDRWHHSLDLLSGCLCTLRSLARLSFSLVFPALRSATDTHFPLPHSPLCSLSAFILPPVPILSPLPTLLHALSPVFGQLKGSLPLLRSLGLSISTLPLARTFPLTFLSMSRPLAVSGISASTLPLVYSALAPVPLVYSALAPGRLHIQISITLPAILSNPLYAASPAPTSFIPRWYMTPASRRPVAPCRNLSTPNPTSHSRVDSWLTSSHGS